MVEVQAARAQCTAHAPSTSTSPSFLRQPLPFSLYSALRSAIMLLDINVSRTRTYVLLDICLACLD